MILSSDTTTVIATQCIVGVPPCLSFSNTCEGAIGKNVLLFFTMKVILTSMRFFDSEHDEKLPNRASLPTQPFF